MEKNIRVHMCPLCGKQLKVKEILHQDNTTSVGHKVRCENGHRFFLVDGRGPSAYNRHEDGEWK